MPERREDLKVLIVDNNRLSSMAIRAVILGLGGITPGQIGVAKKLNEAKEMLFSQPILPPKVVILDTEFPDGFVESLLERMRREDSPFKKTPVIVFTANRNSSGSIHYIDQGANSYVMKPDMKGLEAKIKAILKQNG